MDESKENKNPTQSQMENEVLHFWDEAKIFEKSLVKDAPRGDYVFYDGPPFATGLPHYGHIVASTMKDVIPRYKTMQGYRVERKWGWDCHGLPIENIAEKELGSKKKKDIEEMGVDKFNEICRSKVLEYVEAWKAVIKRLGRWADMENSYKTMDLEFMESVWWVFKELWDKELIYESYRSMHICPRCETTLSQMEVSEGYKNIKDLSATVKFKLDPNQRIRDTITDDNTYILAWTTTPWTLPGNVALAVGEDIDYVKVKLSSGRNIDGTVEYYYAILAKKIYDESKNKEHPLYSMIGTHLDYAHELPNGLPDKPEFVFKDIGYIVKEFKGSELKEKEYKPVFDYYYKDTNLLNWKNGWKIYAGDFVTTTEGTGIVHIAPGFGEDDLEMSKKYTLPFIQHVNMDGTIKKEAGEFAGKSITPRAKDDPKEIREIDLEIVRFLGDKIFDSKKYEHSYPHCWRCDTPLINYATSSWFVNVLKIKDDALRFAKEINWSPEHIKDGRFGKWLEGARDWSISRQRFWASVMPIWKCKCGEMRVFGSVADLEKASGQKIADIHKHIVDKIKFPCEKCTAEMTRVPDVLDTWFDSGSMPYAQMHYPFENKEKFDNNFPAEFIAEGVDQTRAWFYYLHIIGTAIKGSHTFKNVIVNGIVLAEDGKKMSKRLNNYPDPMLIVDKYGADALRFYLTSSPVVSAENLNFTEKGVEEVLRKNVMTLWNVYKFYELFAGDVKELQSSGDIFRADGNALDKWILIKFNNLISEVTGNMDRYDLAGASRPITGFVDDLSTWYLRRSRERFKSDNEKDKQEALLTTKFILMNLSKIIAPFMPFVAENIWQKVSGNDFKDEDKSAHLEEWPLAIKIPEGELSILAKMDGVRKVVELGLAERKNANIKIRQALQSLTAKCPKDIFGLLNDEKDLIGLIKDELNIKEVKLVEQAGNLEVELDTTITHELELEGIAREVIRAANSARKEVGLSIGDMATLYYSSEKLNEVFDKFGKGILKEIICEKYIFGDMSEADKIAEIKIGEEKIQIGIKAKK